MNEQMQVREKPTLETLEDNIDRTKELSTDVLKQTYQLMEELTINEDNKAEERCDSPISNRFDKSNNKIKDIKENISDINDNIKKIRDIIGTYDRPETCEKTPERIYKK